MEKKKFMGIDRCRIRKYWEKTDSEVEEYIEEMKDWIKTKNFPEMPTDHMIEFFLTNCKYNVENTKINIETFYTIRKLVPEVYENSNPRLSEIQEAWDMGGYLPLPALTEDLCRISIVNLKSSSKFNAFRYFANIMNIYEVRVCEDLVLGEICIIDYSQLKWGQIFHFSPFLIRKMVLIMENVAKSRIKQMHVIRSPSYVNILVNIGKKLMKKKMADRVHIHKSMSTLYDYVPQEFLPRDYGGKAPSLDELTEIWKRKVAEYQDRFDMWDRILQEDE